MGESAAFAVEAESIPVEFRYLLTPYKQHDSHAWRISHLFNIRIFCSFKFSSFIFIITNDLGL